MALVSVAGRPCDDRGNARGEDNTENGGKPHVVPSEEGHPRILAVADPSIQPTFHTRLKLKRCEILMWRGRLAYEPSMSGSTWVLAARRRTARQLRHLREYHAASAHSSDITEQASPRPWASVATTAEFRAHHDGVLKIRSASFVVHHGRNGITNMLPSLACGD